MSSAIVWIFSSCPLKLLVLNLLLGRIGVSALLLCGVYRDKIINVLCVPAPRSVSIRLLTQRQEEGWKGGRERGREGVMVGWMRSLWAGISFDTPWCDVRDIPDPLRISVCPCLDSVFARYSEFDWISGTESCNLSINHVWQLGQRTRVMIVYILIAPASSALDLKCVSDWKSSRCEVFYIYIQ